MKYTNNQNLAINTFDKPLLLVAGAGAGKTSVVVEKLAVQISNGVQASNCAALTYTKRAAFEMKTRLAQRIGLEAYRACICNWHSFAFNQVIVPAVDRQNEMLLKMGYVNIPIILTEQESLKLIRECASDVLDDVEFGFYKESQGFKRLLTVMNLATSNMRGAKQHYNWQLAAWGNRLDPKDIDQALLKSHTKIWIEYESRMKKLQSVDYNYILLLAYNLLRLDEKSRYRVQKVFTHILCDEHQDSAPILGEILRYLVGNNKNLTIVGDDKQSIYSFRNADINQILNPKEQYPDIEIIPLKENFRSHAEIIDLGNSIADIMDPSQRIGDGHMIATKSYSGVKPRFRQFSNDIDEAQYVRDSIEKIINNGTQPKEIGVLFRNKHLKDKLADILIEAGIDYELVGDKSFLESKEVTDWAAFLRFCVNPNDILAASRIIDNANTGTRGITFRKKHAECDISPLDYFKQMQSATGKNAQKKQERFSIIIDTYDLIREILETSPSKEDLAKSEGFSVDSAEITETWPKILETISQSLDKIWSVVFESAYRNAKPKDQPLEEFEEQLQKRKKNVQLVNNRLLSPLANAGHLMDSIRELILAIDSGDNEDDKVQLLTEHASKGLEFEYVFIIGCEDESHIKQSSKVENLHEELRLFYVAVTRAKLGLEITCAKKRFVYGNTEIRNPLRYLKYIPDQFLERYKPLMPGQRQTTSKSSNPIDLLKSGICDMNEALFEVSTDEERVHGFKL